MEEKNKVFDGNKLLEKSEFLLKKLRKTMKEAQEIRKRSQELIQEIPPQDESK